jgi:hypothetical protein
MRSFEFVAGPIQRFFQDRPESLTDMLKICNLFAVRFRRQYINTSKVPWDRKLDVSYAFFEDCLGSSSPPDLARTLTALDKSNFAHLTRSSIIAHDGITKGLLAKWEDLAMSVWECCSAIPDLTPYLRECAQVSRFSTTVRELSPISDRGIRPCRTSYSDEITTLQRQYCMVSTNIVYRLHSSAISRVQLAKWSF